MNDFDKMIGEHLLNEIKFFRELLGVTDSGPVSDILSTIVTFQGSEDIRKIRFFMEAIINGEQSASTAGQGDRTPPS